MKIDKFITGLNKLFKDNDCELVSGVTCIMGSIQFEEMKLYDFAEFDAGTNTITVSREGNLYYFKPSIK